MLAGVDGSEESANAATFAMEVARRGATTCRMLHVVEDYGTAFSAPETGIDIGALTLAAEASARRLIDLSLDSVISSSQRRTLVVKTGRAAIMLANTARDIDASVVVLGSKRHHGLARIAGTTIAHLVRIGTVPVLATDTDPLIARVLVAADLSYAARPTIEAAQRWAALFGAKLRVLHVVEPPPTLPGFARTPDERYLAACRNVEETITPLLSYENADTVVRPGRSAATIAGEAAQWRADLVVVGSHGKGWVDRLLIGSTSERLLHVLRAPLLVIPVSHLGTSPGARAQIVAAGRPSR